MSETPRVHETRVVGTRVGIPTSLQGFNALGQIVEAAREFGAFYQTEHTKRDRLRTYGEVEVERIKSAEGILRQYFDQIFDERRTNFEAFFARLDVALENRDGETINTVVRGIVDIAQSSPLAQLGDLSQIRAMLDDPDQVFDL
ncbi:hypothetical protein TUM20985_27890 [Mycobacterium antarcticum]|uniref:hypothetical protein n=1 Tax=unclassified Mycolicibacterium TaxID=2636767 RepID=UPI0023A219B8|nr:MULTISPECIES: hypothetical protein [unclassified Mycolicibacterium]BDX32242.1 hypothetical protein TUM20985_27890 [Mycolicibacterium sp. TUM20985]GLP84201.1 hypothetical protein TUM20984_56210 [Mycolicibacterium sp. TUM20984]